MRTILPLTLSRRRLLKIGLIGVGVLFASRWMSNKPARLTTSQMAFLTDQDKILLQAICPVILKEVIPSSDIDKKVAIETVLYNIDFCLSRMSITLKGDIRLLFDLLNNFIGRVVFARMWNSWENASQSEIEAFINRCRISEFSLYANIFIVLHSLVVNCWYAQPQSWQQIGYPGPPEIIRPQGKQPL